MMQATTTVEALKTGANASPGQAEDLIRIGVDGSVALDPSLTPDAASKLFWDHLAGHATGFAAAVRAAAFREAAAVIRAGVSRSRAQIERDLVDRAEAEEERALR
jgi:hypothetical protein